MLRTVQSLPLCRAFDTGLRPGPFPDRAASLLPGLLAATRTGLAPASDDEHEHEDHPITSRGHLRFCWAHESPGLASAGSGNLRPGDGGGALDDLAELGVGEVAVPPGDVAADHPGLLVVGLVVGAVEGEVAQRGELRLDPVEPGAVERRVGDLDVVRRCPASYPVCGSPEIAEASAIRGS